MIILHNRHDRLSREFIEDSADLEAQDWYDDAARERWLAAGGTDRLSAFPSVLLRHDRYTVTDPDTGDTHAVEPGWDTMHLPEPDTLDRPLPEVGEHVERGIYRYGDGWVMCRQRHTRMHYKPEETPALFSVYRPESERIFWIANESVSVGDRRVFDGNLYECRQAHVTQADWTPPATPALRALVEEEPVEPDPPEAPEWKAGVAYKIGDRVIYQGKEYSCRQSHTAQVGWEPPKVLALWLPV